MTEQSVLKLIHAAFHSNYFKMCRFLFRIVLRKNVQFH